MYNILFVCVGATCRSPMAAAILNRIAKLDGLNCHASFCGLSVQYGSVVNSQSKQALKNFEVARVYGKPTPITGEALAGCDLVVCLTEDIKEALQNISARKFVSKIVCFKDFCGADIIDPYGKGQLTYDNCCKQIYEGLNVLVNSLLQQGFIKEKKHV